MWWLVPYSRSRRHRRPPSDSRRTGNGASHQKWLTDSSRSRCGLAWETPSIQARSASKGIRAARTSLAEQDWDWGAGLCAFQCGAAICTGPLQNAAVAADAGWARLSETA
jgi:hypothetical protein